MNAGVMQSQLRPMNGEVGRVSPSRRSAWSAWLFGAMGTSRATAPFIGGGQRARFLARNPPTHNGGYRIQIILRHAFHLVVPADGEIRHRSASGPRENNNAVEQEITERTEGD